ncbi:hypothetical protein A2U01_0005117 [Trifolium medium]|uniref:Uncharacterized protein n=1 Tax=Trifolium medium TaxID=97028 RepID=A0A392MA12_9FABA|nr:hypothetical protein [Trifolium medium]
MEDQLPCCRAVQTHEEGSKRGLESGGESVPSGEKMIIVHPLKPSESVTGHVAGNVSKALVMSNGVVIEKLVGLKNPVEWIGSVERKETQFWGFKGSIGGGL